MEKYAVNFGVGAELKEIRHKLGLTQTGLARLYNRTPPKHIRTTRSDVSKYERDVCDLPTVKYKKFQSLIKE